MKLLCAYFDRPGAAGETSFPDVPAGHWAADAIAYAAAQGWISGYPDGSFQPEQTVTRAETVKILNRALGRPAAEQAEPETLFSDVPRPTGPARRSWRRPSKKEPLQEGTFAAFPSRPRSRKTGKSPARMTGCP